MVVFYERIKVILVKSSIPSAYLPKMYSNGKKVSMCQIMAVLSQQICGMFTVSVLPFSTVLGGQPSVSNFEKGEGSQKKNECLGGGGGWLKESLPQIRLYKMQYGFEG